MNRELVLNLKREGESLKGVCYATAEGYFRMPFWVELKRRPE